MSKTRDEIMRRINGLEFEISGDQFHVDYLADLLTVKKNNEVILDEKITYPPFHKNNMVQEIRYTLQTNADKVEILKQIDLKIYEVLKDLDRH